MFLVRDHPAGTTLQGPPCGDQLAKSTLQGTPSRDHLAGTTLQGSPCKDHLAGTTLQAPPSRATLQTVPCRDQLANTTLQGPPCRDYLAKTTLQRPPCRDHHTSNASNTSYTSTHPHIKTFRHADIQKEPSFKKRFSRWCRKRYLVFSHILNGGAGFERTC